MRSCVGAYGLHLWDQCWGQEMEVEVGRWGICLVLGTRVEPSNLGMLSALSAGLDGVRSCRVSG